MFITRVSRRDLEAAEEFYDQMGWFDGHEKPDLTQGSVFVARQGPIVGAVRLIEVAPKKLVVEDVVVVEDRRGQGVGTRLMQAAMSNRGGTLYVTCDDDVVGFYERFGFAPVAFDVLPDSLQDYFRREGCYPQPEDHVHRFMTAR